MRCQHCGKTTRVIHTEQREDGTHRWMRCLSCHRPTRSLEVVVVSTARGEIQPRRKPGPPAGRPRPGGRAQGSRNGASVLTEDDVLRLRQEAAAGAMQRDLAKRYGIAEGTISRIVNRKAWGHI